MLRHAQHERKKCCNDSRLIPFALSLSKGKRRVVEHAVMTHTPVALFLTIVLFCGVALAQDLTKAKQEEHIVFYTSWGPSDADYVIKAFEKKYPFLRVELARSSSEKTLNRLLTEQRANRFLGDVVAISGIQSGILKRCARPLPIQGSGQLSDRVARPRRIRSGLASDDLRHRL